ncbi:related to ADP-ribose pyrophosphatase [Hanseniaspora guilliermondii]|uniref:Related to ADP-ribose pyrophosphatase n=1 Tax=Hanseniaspora guilliermondii TaxID=56406 RepID=A0A1L0B1X0_9ASCO|nr:related to ADP-ribose pyrophosphatase [Hanseniaspora guilliermondii]
MSRFIKPLHEMSKNSPELSKIISVNKEPIENFKWITLQKLEYSDPLGKVRPYEKVTRMTTSKKNGVDAVTIVPLLKTPNLPTRILLLKQFRPACGKVCIEFPAGLVDESDESLLKAAEREMKEETGYTITKLIKQSPVMYADPGITDATSVVLTCEVDLSKPENQNVKPNLDDGEFIEMFDVELSELEKTVESLSNQGYALDARVGGIIDGFVVNSQLMMDWKCD